LSRLDQKDLGSEVGCTRGASAAEAAGQDEPPERERAGRAGGTGTIPGHVMHRKRLVGVRHLSERVYGNSHTVSVNTFLSKRPHPHLTRSPGDCLARSETSRKARARPTAKQASQSQKRGDNVSGWWW
jgi:hypothetical protein